MGGESVYGHSSRAGKIGNTLSKKAGLQMGKICGSSKGILAESPKHKKVERGDQKSVEQQLRREQDLAECGNLIDGEGGTKTSI